MRRIILLALIIAAGAASACAGGGMPAPHPDAAFGCTSNAACDDHQACTIDSCDVSGTCMYTTIDAMCPSGQHCAVGVGCTAVMTCMSAAMCDDGIACTVDSCGPSHACAHQTVNALCTDAATPICDATMGCIAGSSTHCTATADCDDHVTCTVDSCGVDMMCRHTTVDSMCSMGQRCTATGCAMVHGCTTAADCMDPSFWNFCDGVPVCDPEFGCMTPTARMCDDGNRCTTDACDRASGTNGACTTACDHSQTGCDMDPACHVVGPTCATGTFVISPTQSNHCASDGLGGPDMVVYDMSTATFVMGGGMLIANPGPMTASFGSLTDPHPACPSFSATATVSGGVTERYTLAGTFSDNDHFTGTFTANYGGLGALVGCTEGSMAVTGTRM